LPSPPVRVEKGLEDCVTGGKVAFRKETLYHLYRKKTMVRGRNVQVERHKTYSFGGTKWRGFVATSRVSPFTSDRVVRAKNVLVGLGHSNLQSCVWGGKGETLCIPSV